MRIALVCPYSWTYPGGVTRHVASLARALGDQGHVVQVFAPADPVDSLAIRAHRGHAPENVPLPTWLTPLGRTVGLPFNGAMSTVALHPNVGYRLHAGLADFEPDVVHVHEPMVPFAGWAATRWTDAPVVGTFHAYATNPVTNHLGNATGAWMRFNRLRTRIAVSEAAAWTGKRFFGGTWTVIPNGVDLDESDEPRTHDLRREHGGLRVGFIGQAVERKGLGILLPAFEAIRDQVGGELRIVGASEQDLRDIVVDRRAIVALGKIDDETKLRELRQADVLCAPSLGGESFGMVLTEAFASGTPVVASDIAGYRDVVTHGHDGLLVPPGDASALAETLRQLTLDPALRERLAGGAASSAGQYAWPVVARTIAQVYEEAMEPTREVSPSRRRAMKLGLATADGAPTVRPKRLPPFDPVTRTPRERAIAGVRKVAGIGLAAGVLALGANAISQIGFTNLATTLVNSSPTGVIASLVVMGLAMVLRAWSWRAALSAALPDRKIGRRLVLRATSIGVLMSATLPARLGEVSRALVVARRLGRARETLPVVVGTMVSQTVLNLLALVILGAITFSTAHVVKISTGLALTVVGPIAIAAILVALPAVFTRRKDAEPAADAKSRFKDTLFELRSGLRVLGSRRYAPPATLFQLGAWGLQWLSCYLLLIALGLGGHHTIVAAAGVLFAVNVTAVLPVTPSNIGTFQFACVAVLAAYGVGRADALAYGVALQAIEFITAAAMGIPALVREGVSWRSMRARAMYAAPVHLTPLPPGTQARPVQSNA